MPPMGVRSAVLSAYESGRSLARMRAGPFKKLGSALLTVGYTAATQKRGPKGRTKAVDVDKLVEKWVPVVVQLAMAHDRDEVDVAEAQIDQLLTPILSAPIRQVREFYAKLLAALKADRRVPLIVWMGFEAWQKLMVQDAPDEGIKRLKTRLARDIAELVEEDVKPQIVEAITRALRWRDPEQLEAVKEQLAAGHKPKLRGRESCLFLEVGKGKNKATVML